MRNQLKKLKHKYYNLVSNCKVLSILFIIINLITVNSYANEYKSCEVNDKFKIKRLDIHIDQNRKWVKNNTRILVSNTRNIPKKLRKRYDGKIIVNYTNGSKCLLEGRIRQSGDFKDHFVYTNNSIKQSLDINLSNGNIAGIVSFKLLLDGTRGISNDEIFLTELLRELNFISPRTQMVEVTINGLNTKMLFQENSKKELLEYNGKIESAIYESNESDYFKIYEKFEDNNLTNDEIGLTKELDQALKGLLARQTNSKWALKGDIHSKISFDALSNLNLIYINSVKGVNDDKFDNTFLGNKIKKNIINLDKYNLILKSANADHALISHNRKFYWNKLEEYFEPIYYDGNPNIYKNENIKLDYPVSLYIKDAFNELTYNLTNIDLINFKKKMDNKNLNFTDQEIRDKISIILNNLSTLEKEIDNLKLDTKRKKDLKVNEKIIKKAIENKKNNNSEGVFIFKKNEFDENFLNCREYEECSVINLDNIDQAKLIAGDLIIENKEYIYLGYYPNLIINNQERKFNYKNLDSSKINFYFNDGIEYKFDEENNKLEISQTIPEARAYFLDSNINNLKIKFKGFGSSKELKSFPFDFKGLTGCLTFYNSKLKDINLEFENSNCEDSINMVNVSGEINSILVKNSLSDALDMDFSKITVNEVKIENSKNDCLDVSFGEYEFKNLELDICGDKGLSVGETSKIFVENISVNNSSIGVASKDGSITNILNSKFNNVDTCLESYNKKQEFSGGYIKVDKFSCSNFTKKIALDSQSEIIIKN